MTSALSAAFKQLARETEHNVPSTSQVGEQSGAPDDPWGRAQTPAAAGLGTLGSGLHAGAKLPNSPYGVAAFPGSLTRLADEEELARSQGRQHGSFNCLELLGKSLGDKSGLAGSPGLSGSPDSRRRGHSHHGGSELRGVSIGVPQQWNTIAAGTTSELARIVMVHQAADDDIEEGKHSAGKKQRGSFNSLLLLEAHELSVAQSPTCPVTLSRLGLEDDDDSADDMQSLEHRDHRDLLMASSSYQSTGGRAIIAPTMAMAR